MDNKYLESRLQYLKETIRYNKQYIESNPELPEETIEEIKSKITQLLADKLKVENSLLGATQYKFEYNTVYAVAEDITFIFLDEVVYRGDKWIDFVGREPVGWYYGEPDDKYTAVYCDHCYKSEF